MINDLVLNPSQVAALFVGLVLGLIAIIVNRHRKAGGLPLVLHNAAFSVSFLLYGLPLIAYDSISVAGWAALLSGLVSFNVGALVILATSPRSSPQPSRMDHDRPASLILRWIVPTGFLIGTLLYARAVNNVFGLSRIVRNASAIRADLGSESFLSQYPVYARVLYGLGPLCLVSFAVPSVSGLKVARATRVFVVILCVLSLSLSLGRTLLLLSLLWTALSLVLRGSGTVRQRSAADRRKRRRLALGALVSFLLLFQVLAVVLGKTGASDPRIQAYVSTPLKSSALTSLVLYLSGPLPAFGHLVDMDDGYTNESVAVLTDEVLRKEDTGPYYGLAQASSLAKLVGASPPNDIRRYTAVPIPLNAYTYLDSLWLDFRLPGVIGGAFLFGLVLTALAARPRSRRSQLLVLSLLLSFVVWSPFGNKYAETFAVASYLALWLDRQISRWGPRGATARPSHTTRNAATEVEALKATRSAMR